MGSPVLEQTIRTFSADRQAGRTTPAVSAALANGHVRLSAGPFNWDANLPVGIGGGNQAPSPTAYLLGALAGCAVAFVYDTLAPEFGVDVDDLSATARCESDLAGLLDIDGAVPDLQALTLDIELVSPSPADKVDALRRAWLERCPIYLALLRPNDVTVDLRRVERPAP
jgi:uncharacterized OsmC-like protein